MATIVVLIERPRLRRPREPPYVLRISFLGRAFKVRPLPFLNRDQGSYRHKLPLTGMTESKFLKHGYTNDEKAQPGPGKLAICRGNNVKLDH